MKPGFIVNPYIDTKKYKQLIQLLNLKYDPNNKFSPIGFFEEFNSKVPLSFTKPDKTVLLKFAVERYHIENKKKVYFRGFINWKKKERGERNTEKKVDSTDEDWYIVPLCGSCSQRTDTFEISDTLALVPGASNKEK